MISFTIDGTTLSLSKQDNALACNGSERHLPYLSSYRRVNDALVLLLKDRPVETAPDVSLPSKARNVARIGPSCRIDWFVERPATLAKYGDGFHHERFRLLGDRVITLGSNGRYFEIEVETGEIANSWPKDALVVGDRRIDFDYPVRRLELVDGVAVAVTESDDGGAEVYGFDASGAQLWHRSDEYEWNVKDRDGNVLLYAEIAMGVRPSLVVDPRTGEPVDE